ncbi:MAG: hypothetical protein WKG00_34950 [Polyangiaceae bacterium]
MLADLTFEVFRHLELSAAMTRSQRLLCEPQQVEAPAQRTGYRCGRTADHAGPWAGRRSDVPEPPSTFNDPNATPRTNAPRPL